MKIKPTVALLPENPWYEELRNTYRPERVRLLLIGESAPDPGPGERRFFYAPVLTSHDNLFRGVVQGLYQHDFPSGSSGSMKTLWLDRMRADGVFLIDAVPYPVNHLKTSERKRALIRHAPTTLATSIALRPEGIVICHTPTFHVLQKLFVEAELRPLHSEPLPFPLGNWRARFADMLGKCFMMLNEP